MNKLFVFLILLFSSRSYSQLAVSTLIPPGGLVQKQQLWNMFVTNPGTSGLNVRVEAILSEQQTGQPVFSATTGLLLIPAGTKQFTPSDIGPVQYTLINTNYRIDPEPTALLPVGNFNLCYNFLVDGERSVARDCQPLNIQPLSPLLLNLPLDHAVLDNGNPSFSWIPFSGAQLLPNLTYNFRVVEVSPGQSPADAIIKNAPFFFAQNLSSNNLFYNQGAPGLEKKKQYAWQVTAVSGTSAVVNSEIWDFTLGEKQEGALQKPNLYYAKLKKAPEEAGSCIAYGRLRFEYFNESGDTAWNMTITDVTAPTPRNINLPLMDTAKLLRGENLVDIPGEATPGLRDRHLYLLQVRNARNELWQLKFEFRKEDL